MKNSALSFLLWGIFSLLLYGVLRFIFVYWYRPRRLLKHFNQQGITGSSYKPFHGDMNDFALASQEVARSRPYSLDHGIVHRVQPFIHRMVQKHGKVFLSWIEARPRLIVADSEMMKEILADKDGHFTKPPLNPLVDLLQVGVSTLEGQKWANRRRLMSPAFHYEKLKRMVPTFSESCCEMIGLWKGLIGNGPRELDVAVELQTLASDIISRTAFGSTFAEGKRIFELQKEQVRLVLEAYQSIYVPGLRFVPTKKNRRRYEIDREVKSALRAIIERKRKALREGGSLGDDLLGMLLQSIGEGDDDDMDHLRIEDVIEECKLFYFAGQETTANWLTWTMVVLSMHPEWQDRAREEVSNVCRGKAPTAEDLNSMKIVTMILNEVLRLYPPVTALFRYTVENTRVGHISVPAGVDFLVATLMIHHDPEYWGDDAEEFQPGRFAEGASRACKSDQAAFFPFGWGPRICLGQSFAVIEAKMALALILQNFRFELSPSYVHAPCTVITLQPQYGAPLILHPVHN
ncbi:hypothetical protein SAY87_030938 [Trapa incisa]|uniref:Cytochrome P450 n=1 Tax=Trapa incisa TaxID=236973 RepID=A0AAN7KW43_9MYRT|nr:hypothetical protein SAY87_030938 [Trapa incisa]